MVERETQYGYHRPVELSPEHQQITDRIAEILGETEEQPRILVARVVHFCGPEFAERILNQALEIQQRGGIPVKDGSRLRTVGGVFFLLAKQEASNDCRRRAFYRQMIIDGQPAPRQPRFYWEKRRKVVTPLLEEPGDATRADITIIGRPDAIDQQADYVLVTMTHTARSGSIPMGVPKVDHVTGPHTVYLKPQQWRSVAGALKDQSDKLIIQGTCLYDPETGDMLVIAETVRRRREPKKARTKASTDPQTSDETPAEAGDQAESAQT
jgi:hypothetical protein